MKKVLVITGLLALALIFPIGCQKTEETHAVEWYLAPENKIAWEAKLAECRNNPGELNQTPNCINARKAFDRNFRGGTFEKTIEPTFGFSKKP